MSSAAPVPSTAAVERHPDLPVVVVGAGPAGLAAAAQARSRGVSVIVVEAGPTAGAAVLDWGHVRLFSPWAELVDPVAEKLLTEAGWRSPEPTAYPTGREWVERYLAPLAERLASLDGVEIRFDHRVVGVARAGRDRLVAVGRDQVPFTVHVAGPSGRSTLAAAAVIDASGTWGNPNPLGGDGYPAIGEHEHAEQIFYGIPDLTRPEVEARYAGKHVAVAGRGASAQNTLVSLAQLAERHPGTRVSWLVRRHDTDEAFGGGDNDQLEQRGRPGQQRPQGGCRRPGRHGHRLPHRPRRRCPRRAPHPGLDRRPARGRRRRGRRGHRLPPRPLVALRGAPRPGRRAVGTGRPWRRRSTRRTTPVARSPRTAPTCCVSPRATSTWSA